MANLETILKLKDQFSSTITKVASTMRDTAVSGKQMTTTVSSGMDSMKEKITQFEEGIHKSMDFGGLDDAKTKFEQIESQINVLHEKHSAQLGMVEAWKGKVSQLSQAYEHFQATDNTKKAEKTNLELSKAKVQMANMQVSANNSGIALDKLVDRSIRLRESIETAVNREKQLALEAQKVVVPVEKTQTAFERLKPVVDSIKTKLQSTADSAKTRFFSVIDSIKIKIHDMADTSKTKLDNLNVNGLIKGIAGITALKKALDLTAVSGAALTNQLAAITGMFGNEDIGLSYFSRLKDYAFETGQSIDTLTKSTQLFLSTTKNTDQLMQLNSIAEKLAIKNQSQGMEGAGYAINEALSGQFNSLKNRFNLSSAQIEPIKKAIEAGNFEGITTAFNEALSGAGITDELVNTIRNTIPNQFKGVLNGFKTGFAEAGMGALENLRPVIEQVKSWLGSADGQQFFAIIGNGLSMITSGFNWLGQTVIGNWDIIQPILLAIGIIALATGMKMAISWALSAAPLFAVIAIFAIFIVWLKKLGVSTEDIVSFIGGVFGVMGSVIGNVFIGIWNVAVDVAEFLNNVFIDPAYAIEKLFYDVSISVLGFFDNMVQGIVSGINWVIEKINQVSGSDLKTVQVNFISDWISNLESKRSDLTSSKDVVDFSGLKRDFIDGSNAFGTGAGIGNKLFNTVSEGLDSIISDEDAWNASQTAIMEGIGNDTSKISNSVDIGNEQIKYLKDIAEREAVYKFTHNTVVPQTTIHVDVKETADVDEVLDRLAEVVDEAVHTGEEGVHE